MSIFEYIMSFVSSFFPQTGYENTIKFFSLGIGVALFIGILAILRGIFRTLIR